MKSVGEVMAIGRRFEEALQKAIRMADSSRSGFMAGYMEATEEELAHPTDMRLFALATGCFCCLLCFIYA